MGVLTHIFRPLDRGRSTRPRRGKASRLRLLRDTGGSARGEACRSGSAFRGVNEEYRHCRAGLFPQGRGLPMGLSGAHAGPRIYPVDRGGPLFRRLHGQLVLERVSGNPRAHLRPAVRAGLPARARRGRAGGDLPLEARRRRLQGRHHARGCPSRRSTKTASASRWSAAGRPRSPSRAISRRSATLRGVRRRPQSRRHDPLADSEIPPARHRDRRGDRLYPRSRRRVPRRHAHRQHEGAAGGRLGRDLRRLRRAARARPRHSRPQGSGQEHSYRHRLAVLGLVRPHHAKSASA